jgi:hypothetical protein
MKATKRKNQLRNYKAAVERAKDKWRFELVRADYYASQCKILYAKLAEERKYTEDVVGQLAKAESLLRDNLTVNEYNKYKRSGSVETTRYRIQWYHYHKLAKAETDMFNKVVDNDSRKVWSGHYYYPIWHLTSDMVKWNINRHRKK